MGFITGNGNRQLHDFGVWQREPLVLFLEGFSATIRQSLTVRTPTMSWTAGQCQLPVRATTDG